MSGMSTADTQGEYMTITEAAAALGVSTKFVRTLAMRGELTIERNPLYAKGARVRIPKADVDRLMARLQRQPSQET